MVFILKALMTNAATKALVRFYHLDIFVFDNEEASIWADSWKSVAHHATKWGIRDPHESGGQGIAGLIQGLPPANERQRYFVTTSLTGWAQA